MGDIDKRATTQPGSESDKNNTTVGLVRRVVCTSLVCVRRRSNSPRWPLTVALIGVILTIPSLFAGWLPDDFHHQIRLIGHGRLAEAAGSRWDLFTFAPGDPATNRELLDIGVWPWWTVPDLRAAFWRPLSVVTHWIDYRLWPTSPLAQHAHSILWYGLLVWLVLHLYRRFAGGAVWLAGLAGLLYAIDDARAMPVGFIANRNAIIATCLGVVTIILHDRWRRGHQKGAAILSPIALAASLLSAEAGIGTIAYLFAYTLFLDQSRLRMRLLTLVPYALVVVIWRYAWTSLGYGVYGLDSYVDPLTMPLTFARALIARGPVFLLAQLFWPPSQLRLLAVDHGFGTYYSLFAVLAAAIVGIAIARGLRWERTTKFWALGMLLSLVPICATFAADRLLFFVGLGAFPLIAQFAVRQLFNEAGTLRLGGAGLRRWRPRWALALIIVHLFLAPAALFAFSFVPVGAPHTLLDRFEGVTIPLGKDVDRQTVVLVTAPLPLAAGYLPERRELMDAPLPLHTRVLAPAFPRPVQVIREDAYTLQVTPSDGFLNNSLDRLARGPAFPMSKGQQVELAGMTATVLEVGTNGRPRRVSFRFDHALESDALRFYYWSGGFFNGDFRAFPIPPIGTTVRLE